MEQEHLFTDPTKNDFSLLKESVQTYLDTTIGGNEQTIPTGFIDIDLLTGGLHRSDLIILAGGSMVGKTALALNIGLNTALRFTSKVGVVSLQESGHAISNRVLAMKSDVDAFRIRTGRLSPRDLRQIGEATIQTSKAPLYIDDTPNLDMKELRSRTLRLQNKVGLDLLIVDYLQLIQQPARRGRNQKIISTAESLKSLAGEIDVPVLVTSQLLRSVDRRSDHIPILSDLPGGRNIENVADLVLLMYKEDLYDPQTERRGLVDISAVKHRHGPMQNLTLLFLEKTVKFVTIGLDEDDRDSHDPETWVDPLTSFQ